MLTDVVLVELVEAERHLEAGRELAHRVPVFHEDGAGAALAGEAVEVRNRGVCLMLLMPGVDTETTSDI